MMEIAQSVGNVKFQNIVALGSLFPLMANLIKDTSLRKAISKNVPPKTVKKNIEAFKRGMSHTKGI
jgi:Pyruvate/2-oxoacid:ferredoxin oxidoreductase gamma subunit